MNCLPFFQMATDFGSQHISWDTKPDGSIDTSTFGSSFRFCALRVVFEGGDFIAEKSGCFVPSVSNQRFCLREFEREFFLQEGLDGLLDFFRFGFWSDES